VERETVEILVQYTREFFRSFGCNIGFVTITKQTIEETQMF